MRIDVITIFPDLIRDALSYSIPKRAMETGLARVRIHDLRDWCGSKFAS